jgi:hypothetical protein
MSDRKENEMSELKVPQELVEMLTLEKKKTPAEQRVEEMKAVSRCQTVRRGVRRLRVQRRAARFAGVGRAGCAPRQDRRSLRGAGRQAACARLADQRDRGHGEDPRRNVRRVVGETTMQKIELGRGQVQKMQLVLAEELGSAQQVIVESTNLPGVVCVRDADDADTPLVLIDRHGAKLALTTEES